MLKELRGLISVMYMQYEHIVPSLSAREQKIFNQIADGDSRPSLARSLKTLSEYLSKVYNQKCIVLVDEYDAPIIAAYDEGYYKDANRFFGTMFSSLLKVSIVLEIVK
jgi:hypothetical protein